MPECLDYMPWSSVYGLGTMAPAILHVGDYKNDKLKDGSPVQFRLIGLNHDVTKSGLVVPMTWEMVDCMPNRYPWERESGNYGPWPTTDLRRRMNDPNGDIYRLMPDAILEFAVPILKLSVDVAEGEGKLVESEDKFFIKSEVEMYGRAIYSAPDEGRLHHLLLCGHGRRRGLWQRKEFLWARPGFRLLISKSQSSAPRKWCETTNMTPPKPRRKAGFAMPTWPQPPRGVGG